MNPNLSDTFKHLAKSREILRHFDKNLRRDHHTNHPGDEDDRARRPRPALRGGLAAATVAAAAAAAALLLSGRRATLVTRNGT